MRAGTSMYHSRVFLRRASALTILAVAAASGRSHAASVVSGSPSRVLPNNEGASSAAGSLELLPTEVPHETSSLFGAFIIPSRGTQPVPSQSACGGDMVEVEGDYCPNVTETCLRWMDPGTMLRCAEFAHSSDAGKCSQKTDHKRFCIDRYEWPNRAGAMPVHMATWYEAQASCSAIGKRLCSDTEWTLACEGPERTPYPYGNGYTRDDQACNIDKPYILPDWSKFLNPSTQSQELARIDQREPSGSRSQCASPYGAYDMVGNVDEWVVNESQGGRPYRSGLKGGYWGPVRTRCRPMTTAHNESFSFYQIGFRCCGDAHSVDVGEQTLAQN